VRSEELAWGLSAVEEDCQRAYRWYRLACDDCDHFARLARRAFAYDEVDDAVEYARQYMRSGAARAQAWDDYRRALSDLHRAVRLMPA
jgi:hypothetical protein